MEMKVVLRAISQKSFAKRALFLITNRVVFARPTVLKLPYTTLKAVSGFVFSHRKPCRCVHAANERPSRRRHERGRRVEDNDDAIAFAVDASSSAVRGKRDEQPSELQDGGRQVNRSLQRRLLQERQAGGVREDGFRDAVRVQERRVSVELGGRFGWIPAGVPPRRKRRDPR